MGAIDSAPTLQTFARFWRADPGECATIGARLDWTLAKNPGPGARGMVAPLNWWRLRGTSIAVSTECRTNRSKEHLAMKSRRRKRPPAQGESVAIAPTTIFSSDLLTPEEERELLASFWE